MTKRPAPIALPLGLTREDVLYYICEAIEGSPAWARSEEHMVMLVDEMMTSQDIYATLKRYIPDAEWKEAYALISTKAEHHKYYTPPLATVTVTAIGERATILKADGEATSTSFTGTEGECLAWVASQHGELAGRSRKPAASLEAALAAWARTGFADEWELTFRRA